MTRLLDLEPQAAVLTEAQMQTSILSAARDFGYLAYATYRSDRSEPGFPDLVLVRGKRLMDIAGRVIFVEVKTATGKIRKARWNAKQTRLLPGQDDWASALKECDGIEYYLVRPADLQEFYELLR